MGDIKGALRLILADQVTHDLASLHDINMADDVVMLCEVQDEVTYVRHHKRKVAFLFSAMRHFCRGIAPKRYQGALCDA